MQGAMLEAESAIEYINLPIHCLHFIGCSDSCDISEPVVRYFLLFLYEI